MCDKCVELDKAIAQYQKMIKQTLHLSSANLEAVASSMAAFDPKAELRLTQ
jgi:hypothetical protein